jgi:hypothetical protein
MLPLPPPLCPNRLRSNREEAVRSKNYIAFLYDLETDISCEVRNTKLSTASSTWISTAKGTKVICDLTFWVYCTISALSQKSIIQLINTLSKRDSQDTAPGILKFSDLLNLTLF